MTTEEQLNKIEKDIKEMKKNVEAILGLLVLLNEKKVNRL